MTASSIRRGSPGLAARRARPPCEWLVQLSSVQRRSWPSQHLLVRQLPAGSRIELAVMEDYGHRLVIDLRLQRGSKTPAAWPAGFTAVSWVKA